MLTTLIAILGKEQFSHFIEEKIEGHHSSNTPSHVQLHLGQHPHFAIDSFISTSTHLVFMLLLVIGMFESFSLFNPSPTLCSLLGPLTFPWLISKQLKYTSCSSYVTSQIQQFKLNLMSVLILKKSCLHLLFSWKIKSFIAFLFLFKDIEFYKR